MPIMEFCRWLAPNHQVFDVLLFGESNMNIACRAIVMEAMWSGITHSACQLLWITRGK